jgi:hypothetical protein
MADKKKSSKGKTQKTQKTVTEKIFSGDTKAKPKKPQVGSKEDMEQVRALATPRQVEAIDALLKYGSVIDAAEALEITPSRLRGLLSEAKTRASKRGWSPGHDMTKVVPDTFRVKGVSSYYGKDGDLRGQWVKTQANQEHQIAMLLDSLSEVAEKFTGLAPPIAPPTYSNDDLLVVLPWGDPHVGLYAWAEETGSRDYDLEKAEALHTGAVDHLVGICPAAKYAALISVGDLFHADNLSNQTTRSGHALDVDTRYQKVYRTVLSIMIHSIMRALEKFEIVYVFSAVGNHDDVSAYTIAVCLSAWFRNEPRVRVDLTPGKFHWLRHGKCLLGVTHGDTVKPKDVGEVMAADRPQDWGETLFRHVYTGHLHHDRELELRGCKVETLRTLAPRDAWSAAGGYRSGSDMKADIWHSKRGRIARHVVTVEDLEEGV